MSVETIRMALGRLQDEPENESAWNDLKEALASMEEASGSDVERLLGRARARHESRREWEAVARLLELELSFTTGPAAAAMQAELARIFHEELVDDERAVKAYGKLLELRPDDATAIEVLENDAAKRAKWRELAARYLEEAKDAPEDAFRSALHASAADVIYRYGRGEDAEAATAEALEHIEEALRLDRQNRRAATLAELVYAQAKDWENVARVQEIVLAEASSKDERVAAGVRLGRVSAKRLGDPARAIDCYQHVLDLVPGQPDALSFLAEAYSAAGQWDHLVALYEDQLRGGGIKGDGELGMLVQIAMVHWKMREQPASAEPYFERVRRADPAHAGMLSFFRELCLAKDDKARLISILTDAQKASADVETKQAFAAEIAGLAESQENAQKAIDQYKAILRTDPENQKARSALKRLYAQTEGWNALIELYRQDLERTPQDDAPARRALLGEIASVYRDRIKNDAALVTVLLQMVQLDEKDVEAMRELTRVYEALGRWRDLLAYQQRLAEATDNQVEKVNLYRASARRWLEQFSNVQNAVASYEALLAVDASDVEAQQKLRELYQKRRAWPQLYALFERQLAAAHDTPTRVALLGEMAKLAAERLDRGAEAIALQKQILELDPAAAGVLDALEKQAEREKDYATVAEVLERRVETADGDPARLAALQKLGAVYAERLKDPHSAAKTWRRVLTLSPGHPKALRVLRESYVATEDWEGLEQLYASQSDWEGLVDFLSTAADKAQAADVKLELSFRAARIFEEKLDAPERATRSYERVLSVAPNDARAAAALVPIYEKEEKWARLPSLYEILLGTTPEGPEGDAARIAYYRKLAAVTGGPLSDKATALSYARRAYEVAPDTEGLELLESWARAAGAWAPFVESVEARLRASDVGVEERRSLRLKLAEVYGRELGKIDESVAAYRDLVETDPGDEGAIRTLDGILRANGRKDDLRWLFELRAGQASGEARASILEEWAGLEEEVFGDPQKAIELYAEVCDLAPTRGDALRTLARLLVASGQHERAAGVVARHRDVVEGRERAAREVELAGLYVAHLGQPELAYEAAKRALDLSPHERGAIAILARLMNDPDVRFRAASVLEKEYAATGDSRREAAALRAMLEGERDAERRLSLSLRLAEVEEKKLGAAGTAFDVVLAALKEAPSDLGLWDRAEELSARAGRPTDLAEAYRTHLVSERGASALPANVEVELCERAASLHDEQLMDPEGAMPYLERVLSMDPNNDRAFARLKQILTSAERWGELEQLYDRAAHAATGTKERIELLNEVALIAEEIIGDPAKAIDYHERILALDPLCTASLDALEKLYERERRHKDLAGLLERRLETATDEEAADVKLSLGRIYLDRLHEPEGALRHLEDVLRVRENDAEARQLVERLLEVTAQRMRAARVLESVYEARDEVRQLVRVLEIRREGTESESERRELLRRVSVLRDERLRDDAGAFSALSELVPLEPEDAGARERLVEIGKRLGEHEKVAAVLEKAADACERPEVRGEILMGLAEICEDELADVERAEGALRRVIAIDESDASLVIPAARALGRLYATRGKHEELAGVLAIEVRLEVDQEARKALYERMGTLYETVLGDAQKAIDAWRARLADDPADEAALSSLERLYERTESWKDLVAVLQTREGATLDPDERRRTMVRAAEILAGRIGDVPAAIDAWRAVQDEFGPERRTLSALESLYEKAERWVDLAETLEVDLSLAEDTERRLDLHGRLGDVRRLHQGDLPGALEAYREALLLDPSSGRCRAALEAMLETPEARRDAAETLQPLYEAEGDAERLLKVLEIQVETSESVPERLETLAKAQKTAEGPLGDPARAFGFAERGVREAAGEGEVGDWISAVERLAALTGRFSELASLYQEVLPDVLDGDVQQDMRLRIGELAKDKLGDRELAVRYYRQALEARGDDRRAMIALEGLFRDAGESASLLEILRLRGENAETDAEKKKLLFQIASLERSALGDRAAAISTYEAILDVGLEPEAVSSLEALYREEERHADLIALYERELEGKLGDPAELRVKIARVAHASAGDVPRAFDELAAALEIDPTHAGAVAELERLLDSSSEPEHRARAGEMLEPVYLRRADWNRVKAALDARLAASVDPGERRDLLQRLATLHEEQLEDYRAALETVAKLLHEDIADQGVWHELERLAKVASAEGRLAEIYASELDALSTDDEASAKLSRRAGEIYADLGEVDRALAFYRRAHAFEPESRELFKAIDGLLVRERRHADRVDLHRASLDFREGKERLEVLHTIARLERYELGKPETAIETYRAALDVDESDPKSLDALAELYRELGRDRDLADLHLRRAEAAETGEAAAPYRLALARLLREKLEDVPGAIDQLEAIVSEVPWHEGAIEALESLTKDEEHKARVVEILRPLYERADDWKMLVRLNEERLSLASSPEDQVEILLETAKLWETRGGDLRRAFDATRAAFDLDPNGGMARGELERLAESLSAFEELAQSYEAGAAKTDDAIVQRELLLALSKLYDARLDDPRRALSALARLSELDPTDAEPLEAMDTLSVLLSDWTTLIAVLEKKSRLASDEENAAIWRRIAETKLDMLEDEAGARDAYEKALELDPESASTVDALVALYEAQGSEAAPRLVELYARRVELASGEEGAELRYELNLRAATQYETHLASPTDAIAALQAALEARPGDPTVLGRLEKLYRAEEMWPDLLENLRLQAELETDPARGVRLRAAIGDLYADQLESPAEALEQYRAVLEAGAGEEPLEHAIRRVFTIGEAREELRLEAADVLEPVLRARGKHEDLTAALELRLRAQTEPEERARTLRAAAIVWDLNLQKPAEAEGALLRALEDTPDDSALHEEIAGLVERSGGFSRYADALEKRAGATFDAVIQKDLYVRAGRIAEEKLGDDARAAAAYAKAVESAGDAPELLVALDRLYTKLGDAKALAEVLERRVAVEGDDAARADLYHRLAELQIKTFGEKAQGLATLRLALERAPDHAAARASLESLTDDPALFEEAAEALEGVYRAAGDSGALARLYEKRIEHAPAGPERVRMRLDLARVFEEKAGDARAAQGALEAALRDDPADPDVLAELERLAGITGGFGAAAGALEAAIGAAGALPADAARELWVKVAGWRKDRLEDEAGAERALSAALELDPQSEEILRAIEALQRRPGREADLVGTLRRLAALPGMAEAAELRRDAKNLAETVLGNHDLAEAILREMLASDEGDVWAVQELTRLRERAEAWDEVFSLLVRQSELYADGQKIRVARHEAARVARTKLGDEQKAIELYESIFEDDPADVAASAALRELYAKVGRHKELLTLLSRLVDLTESSEERAELRLESATICLEKMDAPAEASEHLRAVLDDDPIHEKATLLLSQILEKSGRDDELADLLDTRIAIAKELGDVPGELTYSVRLGEVYENRLGDVTRAIETYRDVLERDPKHEGALTALARLYEQKGDKIEAARVLEVVLEDARGEAAVKTALRLGDLYEGLKDEGALRAALERGLRADPSAAEIRSRLLVLFERTGAFGELAELLAGDAEATSADNVAEKVRLYRRAADIHLQKRGDPAAAADLLVKATELVPSDRDLLLALCDAYSASGRGKQAAEALRKIVESYGGRRTKELAAIHHRLAKAYLAEGEKESGLAELETAFKIDPGSIGVLRDLGVLSIELSEGEADDKAKAAHLDRAQKNFRSLLLQKLDESAPISKGEVFYYLGEISHRQGDDKKALQMLERALDNDKGLQPALDLVAKIKK